MTKILNQNELRKPVSERNRGDSTPFTFLGSLCFKGES
jgi:hypothetical protein